MFKDRDGANSLNFIICLKICNKNKKYKHFYHSDLPLEKEEFRVCKFHRPL